MITNMRQPEQKPDRLRIAIDLLIEFLFEISLEDVEEDDVKREQYLGESAPSHRKKEKHPNNNEVKYHQEG